MNATPGTMPLPGATLLVGGRPEIGSSALDRRAVAWAAPDPSTLVLDPWAAPSALSRIAGASTGPWPAPLASARIAVEARRSVSASIEPLHHTPTPDLAAIARAHARRRLLATRELPESAVKTPRVAQRAILPTSMATIEPMAPLDIVKAALRPPTLAALVQSDVQASLLRATAVRALSTISPKVLAAVVVGVGIWLAAAIGVSSLL